MEIYKNIPERSEVYQKDRGYKTIYRKNIVYIKRRMPMKIVARGVW
ncbi:MAG: hypothetical protein P857_255 [Candidatus Xenolissoclinum pacificiensis L6]|uniref:Uncharacterized protein n=1 Tax=Candidatus Xenolissoclinum pacificiensis L6 TaxID=1401685 RepID=W2UZF1_9RICK|nr:MAG: hypothetical protein P857_255 [Candidatus Xenolissoclinum pacificiensis L6]